MPRNRPPHVQLVIRIGGKRYNACKLLQEKSEGLLKEVRRLEQHNAALRAKETMQFEMLRSYEDSLHNMAMLLGDMAGGEGSGAEEAMSALSAAMLVLRSEANELMQQLRAPVLADSIAPAEHNASSSKSTDAGSESKASAVALPVGPYYGRWSRRIWACITPEAVLEMRGTSTAKLAERIKSSIMRIALFKHCQDNLQLSPESLEGAVLAYGTVLVLAMVAADQKFLECNCYNLETIQQVAPAHNLATHVLSEVQLLHEQSARLALAFECFRDRRAALLQQQQAINKQLQELLALLEQPSFPDCDTSPATPVQALLQPPASHVPCPVLSTPRQSPDSRDGQACSVTTPQDAAQRGSSHCSGSETSTVSRGSTGRDGSSSQVVLIHLEVAERADELLQELQRIVRLVREVARRLIYVWIDVLGIEQHADAVLASYPFMYSVPAVCQHIWEAQARDAVQEVQATRQ